VALVRGGCYRSQLVTSAAHLRLRSYKHAELAKDPDWDESTISQVPIQAYLPYAIRRQPYRSRI